MTSVPFTLGAETTVFDAAEQLLKEGVSNAPVVESSLTHTILIGFVSEKDLMQCYANGYFHDQPDLPIRTVMRSHPICVRKDADVFTLAALFMQHGFRHLPVVSGQELLGVVSRRDVLAALVAEYKRNLGDAEAAHRRPDLSSIFAARYLVG